MSSISLNFYKRVVMAVYWPICVSVRSWILFPLLALLPGFSNALHPFALQVASTLIPMSLRLGNGIVGLKYW